MNNISTPLTFLVSGYGSREDASVRLITADPETGRCSEKMSLRGISSPSYLALQEEPGGTYLYTLEECAPGGAVLSFQLTEEGARLISRFEADWLCPCHISVSDRGDYLYAASYSTGNVASFRIETDHTLTFADMRQHEGAGPHPIRQKSPHCHYCAERDGQLFVADLGLDKVFIYNVDHRTGALSPSGEDLVLPPGSGPRHLVFGHGPGRLYVLTELTAQVFFYGKEADGWILKQTAEALPGIPSDQKLMVPPTADPLSIGAAIRLSEDGSHLFVSCRLGFQCVTAFRMAADGRITYCDTAPTGGVTPRDIAVIGDLILAANQDSNLVTFLKLDRTLGTLSALPAALTLKSPTCLVPV